MSLPDTKSQQRQISNRFPSTLAHLLFPLFSRSLSHRLFSRYLGIFDSWTGKDYCRNWFGVSYDPTNSRVADINLRGECEDPIFERSHRSSYMSGEISPEICNLSRLSNLVLTNWKAISGPIPNCITSLPFLHVLDLVRNRLSGPLPASIGKLSHLTVLNVADNQISGRIPPPSPTSPPSCTSTSGTTASPAPSPSTRQAQDAQPSPPRPELDLRRDPRIHLRHVPLR